MIRAGIIGCGDFANRHAQILTQLPQEAELVAFCDRNDWKTRAFQEKYAPNALTFTNYRQMFDHAKLDAVFICLPPYGHTEEVEQAAAHGLHILIEKPIALTSEKGWQMVEAVEKAGVKSQVGFMFRFGEAVEQLKNLSLAGKTGTIGLMTARYFCNALHANWWRDKTKSGGQILEQAIHLFDLMRYLMGEAVTVYSRQENLFHREMPDYTIEDVSASVISFQTGGLGVVYASNGAIPGKWIHGDYQVVAQNLTAEFQSCNRATFHHTNPPDQPPTVIDSERDFRLAQTLDFLTAIHTDGTTRTPIREGAKTLDLVLAAVKSNQQRGEIRL